MGSLAHLSIASWWRTGDGSLRPVAHLKEDPSGGQGKTAPAGAKGCERVSMCQMASQSFLAIDLGDFRAALAAEAFLVALVALGVGRVAAGRGRGFHQRPA